MGRLPDFFKDLVSLAGALLTIVAVVVPFVGKWAPNVRGLLPPWPGDTSAPLIATVLSVFVAVAVYALFGTTDDSNRAEPDSEKTKPDTAIQHRKIAIRLFIVGLSLIPVHLLLATWFIREYGSPPSYTVTGFGLTEAAAQIVPSGDIERLLDEFGHNSQYRCWYGHSVARWLVFLSYLALLATWTATFSFSVLHHRDAHA